jgi:hypothetical protein
MPFYWPRVFWRALGDTFRAFGGRRILIPPVVFAVGSLVHFVRVGSDAVASEFNVFESYGLWTFLVFFTVLFAWNFVLTPPRLESEAVSAATDRHNLLAAEIASLKLMLSDREARNKAIGALWELRKRGVEIRNREILDTDTLREWRVEQEAWRQEVFVEAEKVSANLRAFLTTLDRMREPPTYTARSLTQKHDKIRHILSEILLRMQEFLEADMLKRDIDSRAT